jgi:uncharacterized protein
MPFIFVYKKRILNRVSSPERQMACHWGYKVSGEGKFKHLEDGGLMKQSNGAMRQISAIVFSKRFSRALAAALILAVCGMAYAAGEDKAQPAPGSFESVKQLAEKGNAEAQLKLAQMYQEGKGVAQNLQEAVNWSRKAAEQGVAQAQFLLGQMYASGKGVAKDVKEAAKWLQKAADQGLQAAKDEMKKLDAAAPSLDDEIDKAIKMIR